MTNKNYTSIIVSKELHKKLFQEAGKIQQEEGVKISLEKFLWRLLKIKTLKEKIGETR